MKKIPLGSVSLGVGLMESMALALISLPFRDGLELPLRLAWDGFAGMMGAGALLSVLMISGQFKVPRVRIAPLLALGAFFLVSVFVSEIAIEQVFLALGFGPVTLLWNGVAADGLSVWAAVTAVCLFYNRFRAGPINPRVSLYLALYEALFVAWQLGGLPWVLERLDISSKGPLYAASCVGWALGGFISSALVIRIYNSAGFYWLRSG